MVSYLEPYYWTSERQNKTQVQTNLHMVASFLPSFRFENKTAKVIRKVTIRDLRKYLMHRCIWKLMHVESPKINDLWNHERVTFERSQLYA